jgi:hypothetical protein
VQVTNLVSVNLRRTSAKGLTQSGDYATHRGDALSAVESTPLFATAFWNADLGADGMPWTNHYATESWEVGAGALFDITVRGSTNIVVGARVDRSHASNVDYAGTLDLSAGTSTQPVFRTADSGASGRDTGVSWSVSVMHTLLSEWRPYVTIAEESLALDENNNKYNNAVIEAGHIGDARLLEAGVKTALLDERLYLSTAVYDQARVGVTEDDDPAVLDAHVSSTATRGIETELRWEPDDNLSISFYALRQRTEYSPNVGATVMVDARALGFADVLDASGNVIYPAEAFLYGGRSFVVLPPGLEEYEDKHGNPEIQLGALVRYELRNGLGFTLSGNYFSSVYTGRLKLVELPVAQVYNVGVVWRHSNWHVKYDLLNALDEHYFRPRTGDTLGDPLVSAMPGRRSQLTFRMRF